MAPKDTPKDLTTPKAQRTLTRVIKKPILKEKTPVKVAKTPAEGRQRTSTVPKENKVMLTPGSASKTPKKKPSWKRRPKPAHSGVPVPEKMKKLLEKLQDEDFL